MLAISSSVNGVCPFSLDETVGQLRPSGATSSLSFLFWLPISALTASTMEEEYESVVVGMSSSLSVLTDSASRHNDSVPN